MTAADETPGATSDAAARMLRIRIDTPGGRTLNLAVPLGLADTAAALIPLEQRAALRDQLDDAVQRVQADPDHPITLEGRPGETLRVTVE